MKVVAIHVLRVLRMPLSPTLTHNRNKTPSRMHDSGARTPRGGGALSRGLLQVLVIVIVCTILFMGALIQYHTTLGIEHEESKNIGDFVSNIIKDDIKAIKSANIPAVVTRMEGEIIHKIAEVVTDSSHSPPIHERANAQSQSRLVQPV